MESIAGMQSAINQSNATSQQDASVLQGIAMLNNKNLTDFNDANREMKKDDSEENERNLQKLGSYAGGIAEKSAEAKEWLSKGKSWDDLRSVKFSRGVGGAFGKAGSSTWSAVRSARSGGFEPGLIYEESEGDTNPSADLTRQAIRQRTTDTQQAEVTDGDTIEADQPDHFQQPAEDQAPNNVEAPEGSTAQQSGGATESTLDLAGEEAGEEGVDLAGGLGKVAGAGAKVGGALFSVGMLGDDIYNQVKNKSFFDGENTGDKIGNFLNEAGSIADIGGIATGDPLLVMAGVGIGAIGGAISDISELFAHKDKEANATKTPPKTIIAPASQNIGGQGDIAQTTTSSLRSVQVGGS